jgi:hypothetical protein
MAVPMASTEATEPDPIRVPELRLAALLHDIEELHAELKDLERRLGEVDGRRVDDGIASPRTASAEDLAQRATEELLRRGRADIGASLAKAEQDASALIAQARAQVDAGNGAPLTVADGLDGLAGVTFSFPAETPRFAGPTNEDFWREPDAPEPDHRRWARPAEIAVHLVILLVLVLVLLGAIG